MTREKLQQLLNATFGHLTDAQLMAADVWAEARGETREGKIAVASVIMERVEHRDWDGQTVNEVILCPWQFSSFLPTDPNFRLLQEMAADFTLAVAKSPSLQTCLGIAEGILAGAIPRDPIIAANNCTQYVTIAWRTMMDGKADQLWAQFRTAEFAVLNKKRWWTRMRRVATIGHHEFYA
jgi:hypothetical protein